MRFFIVGGNENDIKCSSKKYIKIGDTTSTTFFNSAIDTFNDAIKNFRYKHMYLIADFGCSKPKFMKYTCIDSVKEQFPYLIIAEYHFDDMAGKELPRKDSIILEKKGISEEFSNNVVAINKFMYYIDNRIRCSMKIKYKDSEDHKLIRLVDIISVEDILFNENPRYISRIHVSKPTWSSYKAN